MKEFTREFLEKAKEFKDDHEAVKSSLLLTAEKLRLTPAMPVHVSLDLQAPTHRRALEAMIRVLDSTEEKGDAE